MTDWHDSDTNSTMPKEMQYELTSINGWWQSWTIAQDPDQTSSGSARGYGTVPPRRKGLSNDASVSLIEVDIEDAMDRLGMGFFQYQILVAAGLCFASDAMEVLLLSFLSTILTVEWGLQGHETDVLISVVFLGAMFGTLVLSPLGDMVGRRPVFSLTAAIIAVFGVGTAFCTNYEALLCVRFMVGFGVGGLVVPFDTLAEFLPAEYRGPNLLYIEFFWTFGTLLVPVFAWFSLERGDDGKEGSWQLFCILCAIPCILSTILGVMLVPESPRWLLTKGKNEKAIAILRHAATKNGLDPDEVFPPGTYLIQTEGEENSSLLDLFSRKWLRTTLLLWVAWFGLAFLYYGAILAVSIIFSHVEQGENGEAYNFDYQAIFISASSEFVGLLLVLCTIDRWGRIPTQTFTYILGGVSCLLLGYTAHFGASRTILIAVSFLARLAMMGATCTTWVSTSEILTTDIRATGHGYANAMARIGGFFCPYVISESIPLHHIGFFLFFVSCISAAVVSQLPETSGQRLGADRNKSLDQNNSPSKTHGGDYYTEFEQ